MRRSWLFLLLVLFLPFLLVAQTPPTDEAKALREYVLSKYTKYEYEIPMRDAAVFWFMPRRSRTRVRLSENALMML